MKIVFILTLTCLVQFATGQYRMSNTPETSMLSENNANCIAGDGDAVHVVWHEEQEAQFYAGVYYRRSLDNGNTWEDAVNLGYGFNPSIAVQGNEVHVVYSAGTVYYWRSMDNGNTWDFIQLPDNDGDHPSLAVSGSQVHVVWHEGWGDYGKVEYCRSDDRGNTWSAIQTLSDEWESKAKFPSIAINEAYVHVVYQVEDGLYYHRSDDKGHTWPGNNIYAWPYYSRPSIAASGRWLVITCLGWDIATISSTDHGVTWDNGQYPINDNTAGGVLSPHIASSGKIFFLSWNQIVNGTWSILTTYSNDGGVTWYPFLNVSPITGHLSCRPFALLKGKDIHLIATDNIHAGGKHEIFYLKEENKLIELGKTYVEWGFSTGNEEIEICYDIAVDEDGNVYATGYFEDEIDMDPGPSEWILTSAGRRDMFVAKYDPNGHLLWARNIGGVKDDSGKSICLDAQGNIYVAGGYDDLVNFDPLGEGVHIYSRGGQDIFILRLNNDGQFISSYVFGGDGADSPGDISLSKSGNIILNGEFSGTVDFNRYGYFPLTSNGPSDIFLCILDPEGKFINAQAIGGRQNASPAGLAIDLHDNIYMTGTFKDTMDLIPGPGVREMISKGQDDAFILAVDSLGQYRWSGLLGSTGRDYGHDIVIDSNGHLILTGEYNGVLSIETDSMQMTLPRKDAYLVKLDQHGGIRWSKGLELDGNSTLHLATNAQDHIYVLGSYEGVGTDQQTEYSYYFSDESDDLLLMKYNSDGEFLWLSEYGGPGYSYVHAIAGNGLADIYLAGTYNKKLYLDPGNLNAPLGDPSGNPGDIYIAKIVECMPSYVNLTAAACEVYIAPDGVTEWTSSGTYQQMIQTTHGCDSVVTVDLTILESTVSYIEAFTCDEYTSPTGKIWSETGMYLDTLTNISGCDSIISIGLMVQRETHWVDDVSACETFQTPQGHVITSTGLVSDTLINQFGCDSIVIYDVEILLHQTNSYEITACHSYTTPDSLHTWDVSGVYQYALMTEEGCDSIVIYNVEIQPQQTYSYAISACHDYTTPDGLHTWDASGVYQYSLMTAAGCDSIITVDLSIVSLDLTVIEDQSSLMAVQSEADYQWMDCTSGALLEDETSQTYQPTESGTYAVIISHFDCRDTSACIGLELVGYEQGSANDILHVYPNPAKDFFRLDYSGPFQQVYIEILDILGRVRYRGLHQDNDVVMFPKGMEPGMFFVKVGSNGTNGVVPIIVH